MNNSLFPDVDPDSAIAWTGPPSEIVTVQSLLYASLVTSLFAALLAMLGKQWVNRYLRNHGGSVGDKSRDRQRKLDGFGKWHFYLAIEGLTRLLFSWVIMEDTRAELLSTVSSAFTIDVQSRLPDPDILDSAISALIHLDPLQAICGALRCEPTARSSPGTLNSKPGRSAVRFVAPRSRSSLPIVGSIL